MTDVSRRGFIGKAAAAVGAAAVVGTVAPAGLEAKPSTSSITVDKVPWNHASDELSFDAQRTLDLLGGRSANVQSFPPGSILKMGAGKVYHPGPISRVDEFTWDGDLVGKTIAGKFVPNEPLCIRVASNDIYMPSLHIAHYANESSKASAEISDKQDPDSWKQCRYVVMRGVLYRLDKIVTFGPAQPRQGVNHWTRRLWLTKLDELFDPNEGQRPFTITTIKPETVMRLTDRSGSVVGHLDGGTFVPFSPYCIGIDAEYTGFSLSAEHCDDVPREVTKRVDVASDNSVDDWLRCQWVFFRGRIYELVSFRNGPRVYGPPPPYSSASLLRRGVERYETQLFLGDEIHGECFKMVQLAEPEEPTLKSFRVLVTKGYVSTTMVRRAMLEGPGAAELNRKLENIMDISCGIHTVHRVTDECEAIASVAKAMGIENTHQYEFQAEPVA